MDNEHVKGSANEAKGKLKEKAGKALGDKSMQGEGKIDQAKGKLQDTVGNAKDKLRK